MGYADLHCDTITECFLKNRPLFENDLHISLRRAQNYRPWLQFFAVWMPDSLRGAAAEARFWEVFRTFVRELRKNSEYLAFCGNARQLARALQEGKNPCFLSIEGSAALRGRLELLHRFCGLGVRMVTLTWNGPCEAGDGCMTPEAGGLTPFGKELVGEMAKLSMLVDVSHLSDRGFDDVASLLPGPFVASHSNARAVCGHPRNLTDGQFREIVRRGGLAGLNLCPAFLSGEQSPGLSAVLPHIEHFLSLGGENALAVGADFDGAPLPRGIGGVEDMQKLRAEVARAFSEEIAEKLFFRNAAEFLKSALTDCKNCYNISIK